MRWAGPGSGSGEGSGPPAGSSASGWSGDPAVACFFDLRFFFPSTRPPEACDFERRREAGSRSQYKDRPGGLARQKPASFKAFHATHTYGNVRRQGSVGIDAATPLAFHSVKL